MALEVENRNTTNAIAYTVLAVFCLFLLLILIKAFTSFKCLDNDCTNKSGEIWLILFKDGFLLLGGALTTLIGYYFGNRGSEQALANAETIRKEAKILLAERERDAPTISEDDENSDIKPL